MCIYCKQYVYSKQLNIAGDSISLQCINYTDNEMNNHGDSRALWRIKNTAKQRKRRQDPARREEEQVANTA
jgi:serine/threonine protein phosphatase PrpC